MRRRLLARTFVLDMVTLAVSVLTASLIRYEVLLPWRAEPRILTLTGSILGAAVLVSYLNVRIWGPAAPQPSYGRGLMVVAVTFGLVAITIVTTRVFWSRQFLGIAMASWLLLALTHRFVSRHRPWQERMVVISDDKRLLEQLSTAPHVDICDIVHPQAQEAPDAAPPNTSIVVDLRGVMSDRMAQYVASASIAGYTVRSLSNVYEEHTGRIPIFHLAEGWEMRVPIATKKGYVPVKRVVDTSLILLLSPLVLVLSAIIAALIRLESPGPVIFRQTRVGLRGQSFTIHKFRTMVEHDQEAASRYAVPGDGRITRVGSVLRKLRLDELPQLWNVIKGDLAIVGPRPEWDVLANTYKELVPFYEHRHLVRPGITGWAQVNQGYTSDPEEIVEKLAYDLYYVKHMSPWLDLNIFGRSIRTVMTGFGAA